MGRGFGGLLGIVMCWQASPALAAEQLAAPAAVEEDAPAREQASPTLHTRDRNAGARVGLIVGGSVALGLFYGLPCASARGLWCVPFAGPVLVVAKRERDQSQTDQGEDGIVPPAFVYALAGSLGVLQLTGAALVTAGVLLPRREVSEPASRFTLLPLVSSSAAGVTAIGTW